MPSCFLLRTIFCLLQRSVTPLTSALFLHFFLYSQIQIERVNYVERPLEQQIHMHMFDFRHSACRIMESIQQAIKQVLETKPEWLITAITELYLESLLHNCSHNEHYRIWLSYSCNLEGLFISLRYEMLSESVMSHINAQEGDA